MTKFKIMTEVYSNQGYLAELPPFEIEANEDLELKIGSKWLNLEDIIIEEFYNDEGRMFGVGTKVTIERVK